MTQNQQTDLKNWKQNPEQELPASLENALIDRCLETIKNNPLVRNQLNKITSKYCITFTSSNTGTPETFNKESKLYKILIILTLLSRTPEGQAFMPFLDVRVNTIDSKIFNKINLESYNNTLDYNSTANILIEETQELLQPQTLDHLLYQEFTEALRTGKTVDEALKTINLTYLQND